MYEIYQNKALGARTMLDYYLKQITDVADEPLGLTDAVLHSYLDLGSPVDSAQSDYVGTVCTAARQSVETIINGPIGEQEWELGLTGFPCGYVIEIHKPPLIQVQSIKYTKNDGTEAVLYDATASPVVQSDIFNGEHTGSHISKGD
jgi:hypothetical protein